MSIFFVVVFMFIFSKELKFYSQILIEYDGPDKLSRKMVAIYKKRKINFERFY